MSRLVDREVGGDVCEGGEVDVDWSSMSHEVPLEPEVCLLGSGADC